MSKSLNLYAPAVGGAALALGLAYGLASRDHGATTIENLEIRVAQTEASVARAIANAEAAQAEAARLQAERDQFEQMAADAAAAAAAGSSLTAPAPVANAGYGLGRTAHPEEVAAWNVDVSPDGTGLPEGSGDVWTGEEVFVEYCASCHGDFAEGVGNWPVLAGGFDTLADRDPVKTVGSYWPYLSTVWDYVHRSMPFGAAGTLDADQTYAIVAYILYSNGLVEDDFVLNKDNFAEFEMYNTEGFVVDDRPELEYAEWRSEPCMENCKPSVEITMRATFLDVTPDDGGASVMNDASASDAPVFTADASADAGTTEEAVAEDAPAAVDPELVAAGERAFRQCASCHQVGEGAANRTGPALNGVVGATVGSADGFRYSGVFSDAAAAGDIWTEEKLTAFLADPRASMPGTRMSFRGVRDEADIAALIAYLATFE